MNYRPFGKTEMQVSEIGLGAWQLANPDWGATDSNEALQIVQKSLDEGCNFFDTAPGYNGGKSEAFLGQVLKSVRQDVILCTKFGHSPENVTDFSVGAIRPSLEGSLRRLQTDYIDILLLHNPPAELMHGGSPQYAELEQLKQEGKIREFGVSLDDVDSMKTVLETTNSKALEIYFNIFSQDLASLFSLAEEKGVGLIVKVPLDSGWLTGKYNAASTFDGVRGRWPEEVIARRGVLVEQLQAIAPDDRPLVHTALQYILAYPAISTIIPGGKTVVQALENIKAAKSQLPQATIKRIRQLWEKELQANPLPW